jgi:hypothetical protein
VLASIFFIKRLDIAFYFYKQAFSSAIEGFSGGDHYPAFTQATRCVAVARELTGFVWAVAQAANTPSKATQGETT